MIIIMGEAAGHQDSGVYGRFFLVGSWKETVGPSIASLARGRRVDVERA